MSIKYVQSNTLYQAGSGNIIGATTVILTSLTDIYGNVLTMTDFGAKGYITLEPDTTNEEGATFTGITANANGTYTLTGVSTILAKSPYTETSGLVRNHAGGTKVVITDNVAFWNTFANKANDETVTGKYTFPNTTNRPVLTADTDTADATGLITLGQLSRQAISGASNASTTVKGIVELATQAEMDAKTTTGGTGALLVPTPDVMRSTLLSDYKVDTGAANAYVITPAPAITAYTVGQIFSFKAVNANTTTSTLAVNGLTATTIKKLGGTNLVSGDIAAGQIVIVEYDGTNFQMLNPVANAPALLSNTAIRNCGDGSDGDVTVAGTTTLTRHMYYHNLTVTGTLVTAGFIVFVSGTLSGNGTIKFIGTPNVGVSGQTGAGGRAGGAGGAAQGGYFVSKAGGAGGNGGANGNPGSAGTSGANATSGLGVAGVAGGAGGIFGPGNGGAGTGGSIVAPIFRRGVLSGLALAGLDVVAGVPTLYTSNGGAGGGAGGDGQGTSATSGGGGGGGGGESGGIIMLVVNAWTGTVTLSSVGAAGGAGGNGSTSVSTGGGGGGGAGGAGGVVMVFYVTKTWTGSYTLTGGALGVAGAGGGPAGSAGTVGTSGTSIEIDMSTLTL